MRKKKYMKCKWQPIKTAPKDGTRITLLIPYSGIFSESECTDKGSWNRIDCCFRFDGDDGPDDIQPTHWRLNNENK